MSPLVLFVNVPVFVLYHYDIANHRRVCRVILFNSYNAVQAQPCILTYSYKIEHCIFGC